VSADDDTCSRIKKTPIATWQEISQNKLDELRTKDDFKKLEKNYNGFIIKAEYTKDGLSHFIDHKKIVPSEIIINPCNLGMFYKTHKGPYMGYEDSLNGYFLISIERLIVHEAYHSLYPGCAGEKSVIYNTNLFMNKYYPGYKEPEQLY
jgi:hypothetical protein